MSKFKLSGSILVFLGAVLWSLNSPLVKYLTADPMLICALRSLIAGIALAPFIRIRRLNWTPWMILYIISYCALCITIILALSKTSATIAVGMQYTAPVWLFAVNYLLTRKLRINALIPVLLICAGVICFMLSGISSSDGTGNLIALTEGVFFACMSVGAKESAGRNPLGLVAIANLFTGVFVFLAFPSAAEHLPTLSGQSWLILLILGVVQIGAGYSFFYMGIQKIPAQKASIIALWEMILGPLWVAIFLGEYPGAMVLIGFLIILVGMVLDSKFNVPISADDFM